MKKVVLFLSIAFLIIGCRKTEKYVDKIYEKPEIIPEAPSAFMSPEESMKTFYLPEGYKVELVASEPMVDEPVAIAWDGDGRMYVAEMNTYMQDVDGSGTKRSISKIKLLEDLDGDGKMDKSTVFIDSLLLPRMILPLENELIVNETFSYDLWSYKDTDGDGVADEKKRVYHNKNRRGGNLEHQQSGLLWNLDNWVYTTYNPARFKFKKNEVIVDTLENMTRGQWGLTQDDLGIMYYSTAGGENPAYGFQQHAKYGAYDPKGRLSLGFIEPWPVVGTPDVQGGPKRLRKDNTLNHFTGVAGQEIYRGHKLPPSLYGDLFIPEPVGRLVRRAKVKTENGKKVLYNAYHEAEFMASTDLNFRPVQAKTGPDGALYIVDMYRGIIQESNWTREGSVIRPVIIRKGLDKNFGKGRIYRIVHEDIEPDGRPNMIGKSASELIEYLGHPNGWYRNTAQKLIILKDDQSVVSELKDIALDNESIFSFGGDIDFALQRIHALSTLEGLDALDVDLVREKLDDEDRRVKLVALRLADAFLEQGDTSLLSKLEELSNSRYVEIVNQVALTLRYSKDEKATELLNTIKTKYAENEVVAHSVKESLKKDDSKLVQLKQKFSGKSSGHKESIFKGYDIYNELCITCHGSDMKGAKTDAGAYIAPPLLGSARVKGDRETLTKILLNGLIGPIEGKEYGIMLPLNSNNDQWIADVLTYVRAMNDENAVGKRDVRGVRAKTKDREDYWTLEELAKEEKKGDK